MTMRILLSWVSLAVLVGCNDREDAARPAPAPAPAKWLVPDPVSAIRSVLPDGWVVLGVKENASPFYYPKGNGKAIELGRVKEGGAFKHAADAVLWIPSAIYLDDGELTNTTDRQTFPPRLIAALAYERLYLWGEPGDWPTIRKDILQACLSSGEPASEESAAETPWGVPSGGIRSQIEPFRRTGRMGEPVIFKCVVENVGLDAIKLYLNSFTHFWSVEVKGPKVSRHQLPPGPGPPHDQGFVALRPGDVFAFEWSPDRGNGNHKWTLDEPGEYQVKLTYELTKEGLDECVKWVRGKDPHAEDKWLGRFQSNVSTVTVVDAQKSSP